MNLRFTVVSSSEWRKLCRDAAVEQDPEKLFEIVREIIAMFPTRQQILRDSSERSRSTVLRIDAGREQAA
jgi:hypothetical protein